MIRDSQIIPIILKVPSAHLSGQRSDVVSMPHCGTRARTAGPSHILLSPVRNLDISTARVLIDGLTTLSSFFIAISLCAITVLEEEEVTDILRQLQNLNPACQRLYTRESRHPLRTRRHE